MYADLRIDIEMQIGNVHEIVIGSESWIFSEYFWTANFQRNISDLIRNNSWWFQTWHTNSQ